MLLRTLLPSVLQFRRLSFIAALAAFANVNVASQVSHSFDQIAANGAGHTVILFAHDSYIPAWITEQILFGIAPALNRHFGNKALNGEKHRLILMIG